MKRVIARRYGRALLALAQAQDCVADLDRSLQKMAQTLEENPPLAQALLEAQLAPAAQQRILADVLAKIELIPLAQKGIRYLQHQRRLVILPDLAAYFAELTAAHLGQTTAKIRVAHPLTAVQHKKLTAALGKLDQKTMILETEVDPELIGGLITQIGSRVWDGSIRGRLQRLEREIAQAHLPQNL